MTVEARNGKLQVQSNAPPPMTINLLKDAIVAMAQEMVRQENKSLVMPVSGPMPPLRRI